MKIPPIVIQLEKVNNFFINSLKMWKNILNINEASKHYEDVEWKRKLSSIYNH